MINPSRRTFVAGGNSREREGEQLARELWSRERLSP